MSDSDGEYWSQWSKPENEAIRQLFLAFGGNAKTEPLVASFTDISLCSNDEENANPTKGTIYLTTKRMIFLPKIGFPKKGAAHATFDSLYYLSINKSDLIFLISDSNVSTIKIKFNDWNTLLQCFMVFRILAESSIKKSTDVPTILKEVSSIDVSRVSYTSIAIDLPNSTKPKKVIETQPVEQHSEVDESTNPWNHFTHAIDFLNNFHFDIIIKIRILFVLALISSCLKYVDFLTFISILSIGLLAFTAWKLINEETAKNRQTLEETPKAMKGYFKVCQFFQEYIGWRKPRRTFLILHFFIGTVITYFILPPKVYKTMMVALAAGMLIRALFQLSTNEKICSSPLYAT
ncbi:hypothetical protein GPJ56_007927 [Histomonas meleagridis]|uniref:uncharacterized protein n=1 Tax=Histomonas meleagridis TaxID=135588 RepID=UPI0035595F69|nr:hypothetical protein GPJ56_007927 [Histomonas meleagridis]KAH0803869.1 hypothetical protein GO595_002699 [Histomonas meleagridis]